MPCLRLEPGASEFPRGSDALRVFKTLPLRLAVPARLRAQRDGRDVRYPTDGVYLRRRSGGRQAPCPPRVQARFADVDRHGLSGSFKGDLGETGAGGAFVEVGRWDGASGEEAGEPGAAGIAAWCGGLGGGGDPDAVAVRGRTFGERAIGVTVTKASGMDVESGTATVEGRRSRPARGRG